MRLCHHHSLEHVLLLPFSGVTAARGFQLHSWEAHQALDQDFYFLGSARCSAEVLSGLFSRCMPVSEVQLKKGSEACQR